MHRYFIGLCSLMVSGIVFSVPSESQTTTGVNTEAILATMDRLSINLPMSVAGRDPVDFWTNSTANAAISKQLRTSESHWISSATGERLQRPM
jgi:hypothetical protein